jgi:bile acid:Na+ symporter, BASS family
MDIIKISVVLLKISLVIFMAGNLLEMGLKLNPANAIRGLKNVRFVMYTLIWGFVIGPALAYAITIILPLDAPYALGLILMGMTPSAPFLPMLVNKAKGDLGYTAAYMLLAAAGTVILMPFLVPFMVKGLTVSVWAIVKPLLIMILIPLAIGMVILRSSDKLAIKLQPYVKKTTGIFTIITGILCLVVYGKGFISIGGSLAITSQLIFFLIITTFSYWLGFGLKQEQKIVLSIGTTTRNLGAALAPLFSVAAIDQRAIIMVVLGLPIMVLFAKLAAKFFSKNESNNNTTLTSLS